MSLQKVNWYNLVGGQFEKTQHLSFWEFIIIHACIIHAYTCMYMQNDIFIRIFVAVMLIVVKRQE